MRALSQQDWAENSNIKRTRHATEQLIRKLKTAEQLIDQDKTAPEVTQPTYYLWRKQNVGCKLRKRGA